MSKSASTPKTPTLGQTLGQVSSAMPQLYGTSATYNPLFSSLNLTGLNDILNGTTGGTSTFTTPVSQAGWYDAQGNLVNTNANAFNNATPDNGTGRYSNGVPVRDPHHGTGSGAGSVPSGLTWRDAGQAITGTRTTNSTPGFLSIYGNTLNSVQSMNRNANPAMYGMLDTLNSRIGSDLALGNQLSPMQQRLVQQSARAGQAARGLGMGPADAFEETLMSTGYGDQLQQQRYGNALQMLGVNQGVQANDNALVGGMLSGASGIQTNNPLNDLLKMAHDNVMTNYNAQLGTNIANAQAGNALTGGLLSGGFTLGGAAILA